jgi:hypothetical protein
MPNDFGSLLRITLNTGCVTECQQEAISLSQMEGQTLSFNRSESRSQRSRVAHIAWNRAVAPLGESQIGSLPRDFTYFGKGEPEVSARAPEHGLRSHDSGVNEPQTGTRRHQSVAHSLPAFFPVLIRVFRFIRVLLLNHFIGEQHRERFPVMAKADHILFHFDAWGTVEPFIKH